MDPNSNPDIADPNAKPGIMDPNLNPADLPSNTSIVKEDPNGSPRDGHNQSVANPQATNTFDRLFVQMDSEDLGPMQAVLDYVKGGNDIHQSTLDQIPLPVGLDDQAIINVGDTPPSASYRSGTCGPTEDHANAELSSESDWPDDAEDESEAK